MKKLLSVFQRQNQSRRNEFKVNNFLSKDILNNCISQVYNYLIKFEIPRASFVKLTIYNALGKEVGVIVNEFKNVGEYEMVWKADNFASGIYYYKIEAGEYTQTKKMVLIR